MRVRQVNASSTVISMNGHNYSNVFCPFETCFACSCNEHFRRDTSPPFWALSEAELSWKHSFLVSSHCSDELECIAKYQKGVPNINSAGQGIVCHGIGNCSLCFSSSCWHNWCQRQGHGHTRGGHIADVLSLACFLFRLCDVAGYTNVTLVNLWTYLCLCFCSTSLA